MHAYKILIDEENISYNSAYEYYKSMKCKNKITPKVTNSVLELLILAIHHLSALRSMAKSENKADILRMAFVTWYYGIYTSISAMVSAQEQRAPKTHEENLNLWGDKIVCEKFVMPPFHIRIATLVKKDAEIEIDKFRIHAKKRKLSNKAKTVSEANTAICGYISGTIKWKAERINKNVEKSTKKKLAEQIEIDQPKNKERLRGPNQKQKEENQKLKNKQLKQELKQELEKGSITFADQANRVRLRANYTDVLFLAYSENKNRNKLEEEIKDGLLDMEQVLKAFITMAGAFCFKYIGDEVRLKFLTDLDEKRLFSIAPSEVWS